MVAVSRKQTTLTAFILGVGCEIAVQVEPDQVDNRARQCSVSAPNSGSWYSIGKNLASQIRLRILPARCTKGS